MNWLVIDNYPDYEVSDCGQVRSLKSTVPKVLKPVHTGYNKNYSYVFLYNNGERLQMSVHSLVALAFIGPRPEGLVVRHIDGDASNNAATNLVYGTPTENEHDKRSHGTLPLSDDQVRTIRFLKKEGWPVRYLTKLFRRSQSGIYLILNGERYGWVT